MGLLNNGKNNPKNGKKCYKHLDQLKNPDLTV
jgi:hypothetical protein